METYRILKNSATKLIARGRVTADGTIRMANGNIPIVLADECARLGLDPKKVQTAASPIECLARLGINPGGVEVILEDDYSAARLAKIQAAKTPADLAYDAIVRPAIIEEGRAYANRDYNCAGYFSARTRATHARSVWAAQYPTADASRRADVSSERAAHEAEIRSRPGYIAALEGRD